MNTLIKYLLVVVLMGASYTGFSQAFRDSRSSFRPSRPGMPINHPGRRVDMAKEEFISRQLQLSPDEADRFWPVYRQYQEELFEVKRLQRLNNSSSVSNGNDQVNKEIYYDQKQWEIKKRYNAEFLRILSPQKVSLLYKSERMFKDELIRQMGERGQD